MVKILYNSMGGDECMSGDDMLAYEMLMCDGKVRAIAAFPSDATIGCGIRGMEALRQVERRYEQIAMMPRQTHSVRVVVAEEYPEWELERPEADAVVTFRKGTAVGVRTADCVPVMVYARDVEGVAAIHAGWRGTLGGIVDNTLDVLEAHGAKPEEIFVAFGPSISREAYEVDRELAEKFVEAGFGSCVSWPNGEKGKPHVDLQGVNAERFIRRGVPAEHIRRHTGCTVGSVNEAGMPIYQSHRRSGGAPGRMMTYIVLPEVF